MQEVKWRHMEKLNVWKETSTENTESYIMDVKVAYADSIKMSVKWNLVFARFDDHARALQSIISEDLEQEATSIETMAKTPELLETGRLTYCADYMIRIAKLLAEMQRFSSLVGSKHLEVNTLPALVENASRTQEELVRRRTDLRCLAAENKISIALEKAIPI